MLLLMQYYLLLHNHPVISNQTSNFSIVFLKLSTFASRTTYIRETTVAIPMPLATSSTSFDSIWRHYFHIFLESIFLMQLMAVTLPARDEHTPG